MVSRIDLRAPLSVGERMRLAENDLDVITSDLTSMRRLLQGILVSTASASILVAINIAIQFAGK